MVVKDESEVYEYVSKIVLDILQDSGGGWETLEFTLYINGINIDVNMVCKYDCIYVYCNDVLEVWDPLCIDGTNDTLFILVCRAINKILFPEDVQANKKPTIPYTITKEKITENSD